VTEISKQKILKLSNDYIGDWLDVQTHRQVVTDDNLDSSIVLVKISNIFVGDYHAVADKLLISPFVAFIYAEYARDLGYILRALNEPYATFTSLNDGYRDTGKELPDDTQLRLGVIYVIAASIQVCSNPEHYSHDGVAQGLLKPAVPNKDVVKHATALANAVLNQKDLEIGDLLIEINELANGGAFREALAPVDKNTMRVVREITLISNHIFLNSNNRIQGRFPTNAIERILDMLKIMGCLDKVIGHKQISNLQRKLKSNNSKPLTFNQLDIDWDFLVRN
tara:strand:+ start:204 stop:1043 length:840 start_codon:yes stop_codon:yes gene_type:complete